MKRTLLYAAMAFSVALHGAAAAATAAPLTTGFADESASADMRYAASWIAGHADNQNMPFVIVDKKNARMYVFEPNGRLRAATAVLLGAGPGDVSVPGIASREPSSLQQHERTTPAGRFVSEPGHNLKGEDIVWVDYDAKIAIHRLRPDAARAQRAERLASPAADDKRMSFGCIVVPVSFYENVIKPALGHRPGVIYVLPESGTVQSMFNAFSES